MFLFQKVFISKGRYSKNFLFPKVIILKIFSQKVIIPKILIPAGLLLWRFWLFWIFE